MSMTEDIKSLIEKINQEGLEAAQDKAGKIEEQANSQAETILADARKQADRLIVEAAAKIKMMEEKQKQLLSQAGRDFLILLRKDIIGYIERIILQDVRKALAPEQMHNIMVEIIKDYGAQQKGEVMISLKPQDAEALKQHYLAKLKEETQKGILIQPSGDITGGFTISFDAGRSQFEFTDQALANYIGAYLKPQLNEILKQ